MKLLLTAINAKYIHSNLAVCCLKAAAREVSAEVETAVYTINQRTEEILRDIYLRKPEVLLFSCYIWNMDMVRRLVPECHKVLPGVPIWLGGPEVSFDPADQLRKLPMLRGILCGEGEESFRQLAECYAEGRASAEELAAIPGLAFRIEQQAQIPGLAFRIEQQAQSPGLAFRIEQQAQSPGLAFRMEEGRGKRLEQDLDECLEEGSEKDSEEGSEKDSEKGSEKDLEKGSEKDLEKGIGESPMRTFAGDLSENWKNKEIRVNPPAPLLDLDTLPFPYEDVTAFPHQILYYESSRGCPFSCSYCLSSVEKRVRFRNPERVCRELQIFLDAGVPQVKFVDRTFNCRKSHTMAIWRYLIDHDNGVTNFHFEIAADLLDEEALELISRMRPGLIQLEIGVQSTNPRTLKAIYRETDEKKLRGIVARIHAGHNVHQHLDLIAGLPYEDYESFGRSFNDVYSMEPDQLQLGFLKLLKGSAMHREAAGYGIVCQDQAPYEVLYTRWLPFSDVLRLKAIEEMVEIYYNSLQFRRTLEDLVPQFDSPFAFFEKLAEWYGAKQLDQVKHARVQRYELLLSFVREQRPQREEQIRQTLTIDYYLRENPKSRPAFAPTQEPWKDELRRFTRQYGRQNHVEAVRKADGSVQYLLFTYDRRDPLSGDAEVTELTSS